MITSEEVRVYPNIVDLQKLLKNSVVDELQSCLKERFFSENMYTEFQFSLNNYLSSISEEMFEKIWHIQRFRCKFGGRIRFGTVKTNCPCYFDIITKADGIYSFK